jgi:uncharacterized membrane protein
VVVCLLAFLVFLDRYLHRLRPVAVAALVHQYFRSNFELQVKRGTHPEIFAGVIDQDDEEPSLAVRSPRAGAIQAIDATALVDWAHKHDCLVALRHGIGDFVPFGAELIRLYGCQDVGPRDASRLADMVALGDERTIEQDPAFAIRILVDVANLALSPAVNDPTTAVQVLDYLAEALRLVGTTELSSVTWVGGDRPPTGVVIPARTWDDYLTLTVNEIRIYGAGGIQVMRRLRAMLDELHEEIRPEYRAAVRDELTRLQATVVESFGNSVDFDRASAADNQGIGGPRTSATDQTEAR